MTVYMVLTPPPCGEGDRDAQRVAFIKDGMSWPALFLALPWLLYRTMWLVLVGYIAVSLTVGFAAEAIGGIAPFVIGFAVSLLFAMEANNLRRWTLERRGWIFAGVVCGKRRDDYERRFFEAWDRMRPASCVAPRSRLAPASLPAGPLNRPDEVVGLFPEASR